MTIKKWIDYIYPPRCPVCDRVSPDGICESCQKKIHYIGDVFCMKCGKPLAEEEWEYCPDCKRKRHSFEAGRALFSYQGEIRTSLYRLKYGNRREYAEVYGREMAAHLGRWIRERRITRILPVPLHRTRKRERGYNQAALLAGELGRCMDIPVEERLLVRQRKTTPLKTLTAAERQEALRGAFSIEGNIPRGERILLVDDIYTTGSTVDSAAVCLKNHGCGRVYVMTVAIGG